MGLSTGFRYADGKNCLSFMPRKSENGKRIRAILIGLLSGLGMSVAILNIFPSWVPFLSEQLVSPIFTAMMNLLKTIAGPMIFLAILSGIYGIGDIATFGKMGRKLIVRFIVLTAICSVLAMLFIFPFVEIQTATEGVGGFSLGSILGFVTQIIPSDIFSPIITGNMMQIIFIGICCGLGMLILGKNIRESAEVFNQVFGLVQLLMETLGKIIPVFIFISITEFVFSGYWRDSARFLIPLFAVLAVTVVLGLIVNSVRIKYRLRVNPLHLLKKMMPTFITAFTTASSAAAFSINVETCEKRLGISQNLTRFGIPLGQVVYMANAAVEYVSVSMIMASTFDVAITPMWLVTLIFTSVILAVATPPIPGGSLSIFTILFLQLGIPQEAVGIAIGIDLILDYIVTGGDILFLQQELTLTADSLGILNYDKLRK